MRFKRLFIFGLLLLSLPILAPAQSLQLADSLYQKGKKYDSSGNMKQSEFYYREAYNIYRDFQDTASWLQAGKEYASAMMWRSKNEQAMELYLKLLDVEHPANDAYNRGDLYNSMGLLSKRTGNIEDAQKYYQKSLPLAKQSGDSLLLGVVYSNLGGVHGTRGHFSQAMERFKQSIPYFKGINQPENVAISLGNIANIYNELSLYDKALEFYNRSLEIHESVGNIHSLAGAYNSIGSVQRELGNYDQALVSYKKSLELSKEAGTPSRTATIFNNIGLLYKTLGEYDKALEYYRQSLAIHEKTAGPTDIAVTNNNIGQLYWDRGEREKAGSFYEKSYELRKKIGNPYEISVALNTMVKWHIDQKNYSEAKAYAQQLQTIGDTTNSYDILENATVYFGEIDNRLGNPQSALKHFKKAYAYSEYLPKPEQLSSLKKLAYQYNRVGSDSALICGQKAIDIIEEHRANAGATSELRTGFFGQHSDFYKRMASWTLTYGQDSSRAYKLVEQSKARSLSDQLASAAKNIDQQLPEEVRIQRSKKRNRINNLYSRLEQTVDKQKRAEIKEKVRMAELEYAAFENKISEKYPKLNALQSPDPISLERAQEITGPETATLEYAVTGNKLIMFMITSEDVQVEQYSLPNGEYMAPELTSWVADFKDAILANASKRELISSSQQLYDVLIQPFEESLQQYSNLIVVPDGALAYLPFEALSQGDQYLIENFTIKYEPSLTSLTLLNDSQSQGKKDLLAVAGSEFSDENRALSRAQGNLSALPATLIEVDSIATHFKNVSTLKNEQVSERAFKNLLRRNQYQYIHLATHGIIDENQPNRSGLALSAEGEITASSQEDGMLRSSEIFGLNINSDMVVLSACNTGLGKVVEGEGILGMQRSFFYAGTSTVVVSLWNVYDRSTASFMNEFYKALPGAQTEQSWTDTFLRWVGWETHIPMGQKAKAMREAKLKMIKHPLFNHPIYWAPFIVVGR